MGSRTWIKIFCDKWLTGTLREETPELRGVWVDLLTLAGSGIYGDTGEIKLIQNVGFTDDQLSQMLGIKLDVWHTHKKRLVDTERITVSDCNIITICNWMKYQSEYARQKFKRKVRPKVRLKVRHKVRPKVRGEGEGEGEGEVKNLKTLNTKSLNSFVELFNSTCSNLPNITDLSKTRKAKIKARLKEHPSLEWWRSVFKKANDISIKDKETNQKWIPSLDWLIKNDNNAVKVADGNYDKPKDWRDKYADDQSTVQEDS